MKAATILALVLAAGASSTMAQATSTAPADWEPIEIVRVGLTRMVLVYKGVEVVVRSPADTRALNVLWQNPSAALRMDDYAKQRKKAEVLRAIGLGAFWGPPLLEVYMDPLNVVGLGTHHLDSPWVGVVCASGAACWIVSRLISGRAYGSLEQAVLLYNAERGTSGR